MSNIFQEVLTDAGNLEQKVLGPSYQYWQQIKSPSELGMSSNGDLQTLGQDISGLVSYVELLVSGQSDASKTGGPLGNKFFLQTAGQCNSNLDSTTPPVLVDRYIYVDNVPNGNIPFISAGMGENFTDFEGLIPGTISNLNVLSPAGLFGAFMAGTHPPCQEITLETIDVNNNHGSETHFVTTLDIQNQGLNKQGFSNINNNDNNNNQLPSDPIVQGYFVCLSIIGLYILYGFTRK